MNRNFRYLFSNICNWILIPIYLFNISFMDLDFIQPANGNEIEIQQLSNSSSFSLISYHAAIIDLPYPRPPRRKIFEEPFVSDVDAGNDIKLLRQMAFKNRKVKLAHRKIKRRLAIPNSWYEFPIEKIAIRNDDYKMIPDRLSEVQVNLLTK